MELQKIKLIPTEKITPPSHDHEPGAPRYLALSNKYGFSLLMYINNEWWKDYQSKIADQNEIVGWLPLTIFE